MQLPESYNELLRAEGKSLDKIGVNEVALARDAALKAVEALKGSKIVVLGGDVLRMDGEQLIYTGDSWYCDRKNGETATDFLKRSWNVAESYISRYPEPTVGTTLYTIVPKGLLA